MLNKTSAAAVIWAMLAFGGTAGASGADPTPITTQAAYESWRAWYHARPAAPADANGPRYRQLLAEADGVLYFLRGLDDASPQIRELSQRGLISAPIDDHDIDFELWKRLGSRDERIRRQSEEILNARADRLFPDPAVDVDLALNGCGPDGYVYATTTLQEYPRLESSFNWTIPFGGLLRVALASRPLNGSQQSYGWEHGLDPEILDLVVAIRNLEYCPGCAPCEPWQDEIRHLRRLLAQAESRQASQRSAQRLLAMLDQTIPSSPVDDITVEEVKQALARHVGPAVAAADQAGRAPSGEPLWNWPNYRMRVDLERQIDARQTTPVRAFRPDRPAFDQRSTNQQSSSAVNSFVAQTENNDGCGSTHELGGAAELSAPGVFPATWVHCETNRSRPLDPGTYKLLLTFEPPPDVSFGRHAAQVHPAIVAAVVFRANPETKHVVAAHDSPSGYDLPPEPATWQVLIVAIGDSSLSSDDLCVPAPSTLSARTKSRDREVVSFSMSASR